jgi:hypothetical protein
MRRSSVHPRNCTWGQCRESLVLWQWYWMHLAHFWVLDVDCGRHSNIERKQVCARWSVQNRSPHLQSSWVTLVSRHICQLLFGSPYWHRSGGRGHGTIEYLHPTTHARHHQIVVLSIRLQWTQETQDFLHTHMGLVGVLQLVCNRTSITKIRSYGQKYSWVVVLLEMSHLHLTRPKYPYWMGANELWPAFQLMKLEIQESWSEIILYSMIMYYIQY